jgi:hypothetical protein
LCGLRGAKDWDVISERQRRKRKKGGLTSMDERPNASLGGRRRGAGLGIMRKRIGEVVYNNFQLG